MKTTFPASNLSVRDGELLFAGQSVRILAERYGTPLYLMDEDRIRANMGAYRRAMRAAFGPSCDIAYASKAACFVRMLAIAHEEGMLCDAVSCGEIFTARKAGVPGERIVFHSSNKTPEDVAFALKHGVGCFVADNLDELACIDAAAKEPQAVLLRITPGIDPHTFAAVATGKADSKFGFGIASGAAEEAVKTALSMPHIRLTGFHCHVGSQVFDAKVFLDSAAVMLQFLADMRDRFGYTAGVLDLGGGFGVRYLCTDPVLDLETSIAQIGAFVKSECERLCYPLPRVILEPGRSIAADAGLTVYRIGTVKRIEDVRTYVSVDGGMTDNIRFALYGAPYTVLPVTRMDEPGDMRCTVVGRCCESGDVIQPDVDLPSSLHAGDLLAVCTTGAYHYSMASNYNRLPRPPIVMLSGGKSYVAVRRETMEDLLACDVL